MNKKYPMFYAYHIGWGNGFKKKFVSFWIKLFTGKKAHVEIEFPKELYEENCFSASGFDKKVRYKTINFTHPERWVKQFIGSFTKEQIEAARKECNKYIGKPYAHKNVILRFGFRRKINNPDTWWCSEVCLMIGNKMKWFTKTLDEALAPTRMYSRVKRFLKK